MVRRHGQVPAGWQWRDGRPRWIPAPGLRKLGWKGHDLRDGKGQWLGRGASIDAAEAIVAAVEGLKRGVAVPGPFAAFAPPGACDGAKAAAKASLGRPDPRSIGVLLDAYLVSNEYLELGEKTQADRKSKLSRFVDILAGYPVKPKPPPPINPGRRPDAVAMAAYREAEARRQSARERVRAMPIDVLEPPQDEAGGADLLYDTYWTLHRQVGQHMAHGVLGEVSAWLTWCVKPRRAIRMNWATQVDRKTPPGRLRCGTWEEIKALVAAADAMGLPSIGDSVILGVDLSWSQGDRLALTWPQIATSGHVKGTRKKTGRRGAPPLLDALGKPRIKLIQERQAERYGANAQPTHVIICETTGKPWKADHYRHAFADVRAHAALSCPSVFDLRDQDLRDTAVTIMFEAGLSLPEIASRTFHSLKQIHAIIEKHYGEVTQRVADNGARQLNAHLAAEKVTM